MSSVNVYLADGFEEIEALAVVDILRRADIDTTIVSISDQKEVVGAHKIKVVADAIISLHNNLQADMIYLPGGMPGTINLESCDMLKGVIVHYNSLGKNIAAICAAPRILGSLGLLKGLDAVCYPGNEKFLEGAKLFSGKLVMSSNIITGKGAGVAVDFALKMVEVIEGKEKADKIRVSIIAD